MIWQETTQQDSTHLTAATNSSVNLTVTPMKIEKVVKMFKTHRDVQLTLTMAFAKHHSRNKEIIPDGQGNCMSSRFLCVM